MHESARIAICGAGIAGVSLAYHLAVDHGLDELLLIDARPPLSLTSDKSTECYRNWWPGPGDAMVRFMNRSIDLMESLARETENLFNLNRRGYLYLTGDPATADEMLFSAREISSLGAGTLRIHTSAKNDAGYLLSDADGFENAPSGADYLMSDALIRRYFPYITSKAIAALHIRRAGWLSAQQLGRYLLEQALACGAEFVQANLTHVEIYEGQIRSITLDNDRCIKIHHLVNAAGPFLKDVGRLMEVELPVFTELHLKVAFKDNIGVLPRHTPLLIWSDPQKLSWNADEIQIIKADEDLHWLLESFPPGVHTRPEGPLESPVILMLWEYQTNQAEPIIPPPLDPLYPDIVLRGLSTMIPGLNVYENRMPRPIVDGGYYTKTPENRPLIGPLPVEGGWVIGALSGYGIMASLAAGELLGLHMTGKPLPGYAAAFDLRRYQDPVYQKQLQNWGKTGQL